MCTQSDTAQDFTSDLRPPIQPRMPWRVQRVEALENFQLHVRFMDGTEGTMDLTALIHSADAGVFAALADPGIFAQAFVEYGAVTWPGEIDLAPDTMYAVISNGENGDR